MLSLLDISTLTPSNFKRITKGFSSTNDLLNDYLSKFAYNHCVKNGISKTFVLLENEIIVSYITLTIDMIAITDQDDSYNIYKTYCDLSDGFKYPIPAIKIARLATDRNHSKKGFASILFKYSEVKAYITQGHEGCRLITIDAEKEAVSFYEKMGCRKLAEKDDNEYTPMFFTIEPAKRLPEEKVKEFLEFCDMFNLNADKQSLLNYI